MSADILGNMSNSIAYDELEQEVQDAYKQMLEYEIMLLAIEKSTENNTLKPCLKERVKFLMSVGMDELPILTDLDGSEANLLGLPQEMIDGIIKFNTGEIKEVRTVYLEEINKLTKGISNYLLENEIESTSELDIVTLHGQLSDLQELIFDINTELENIDEWQIKMKELKYKVVPRRLLKKVAEIENDCTVTLNDMRELHDKTLHEVYPSQEYYDKINQAKLSLEEELAEINTKLEQLQTPTEINNPKDKQKLSEIRSQYKEIMREIRIKKKAVEEVKRFSSI